MELYGPTGKPYDKRKDTEPYYLNENGILAKLPGMIDPPDVVFAYLMACARTPTSAVVDASIEMFKEVWEETFQKKALILDALKQLQRRYSAEGDRFRSIAYSKAIRSISSLQIPIFSGAQARKLKYVGEGIAKKIDEILETGKLKRLEERGKSDVERQAVVEKFLLVTGVGSKTANEWYDSGYRDLKDVPISRLTHEQAIGIKYYDEFQRKIPRAEVEYIVEKVEKEIRDLVDKVIIVGSYRRGASESGDIDLVVTSKVKKVLEKIVTKLENAGIVTDTISLGPQKFAGVVSSDFWPEVHHRFDIWLVAEENLGAALLHFSGPAAFVVEMSSKAMALGYKLNERGLFRGTEQIDGKTEKELFAALGVEYIPPEDRF